MCAIAPPSGSQKPAGNVTKRASNGVHPTSVSCNPTVDAAAAPAKAEPSWGRVLATTIKLATSRRLRSAGFGSPAIARRRGRNWFRRGRGHLYQLAARRWRLTGLLLLALAVVASGAVQFTGVIAGTASPAARTPASSNPPAGSADPAGGPAMPALAARAAVRSRAAAWIAAQVSGYAMVACDPGMCAALQAQGIPAGRLLLWTGAASPLGASLVATSPPVRSQPADQYAPALIAGFGSGATRIEVRATEPGGAAAYQSALRADLAARKAAGSQLLRNWHIQFTAPDTGQLRAGQVDSRLLATLAALASQYSFRVATFGDTSPGAPVLFREVSITSAGRGDRTGRLAAALAMVRAQALPYLPAHAAIGHLADGQAALTIEFAAPSPLGLLTPVLEADLQPAPARDRESLVRPAGEGSIR